MNREAAGWIFHRRAKWITLALSLLTIAALGSFGSQLGDVVENNTSAWLPGSAESTRVIEQSSAFADPDAVQAVILYVRDSGITSADLVKAESDVVKFDKIASVTTGGAAPVLSEDGKAIQVVATIHLGSQGTRLPGVVDDIGSAAKENSGGLNVSLAGPAALGADQAEAFAGVDGVLLFSALAVVFLILLLTYRSLQLALLFLICGVGAVIASQGVIYILAKYADLTVNGESQAILSVLVLGAGVDYALLLVARYREELHNYEDRHEAMAHALRRAAPAIIASGVTVVIGLLCLAFAQMNSTAGLGPVGAAGVAVALLIMTVMLPALLVVVGRWIFWPFIPRFGDPINSHAGLWSKIGNRIAIRPRTVWVATSLVLVALAMGITQLNAVGLTNAEGFTKAQPSVAAEKKLSEHFPGGAGSPVAVVTRTTQANAVKEAFATTTGIDASTVEVRDSAEGVSYLEGTLTSAADSSEAKNTVERVRKAVHAVPGADALVGGNTAVNMDMQSASSADNKLIIPIVLLVVLLVLGLLLRSIVAPLILLGTVVLSFGAAIGLSALIFRNVFDFAGAESSFPLFVFVFLVALGIDYNIFLMTRVREESLKFGTHRGALIGLAATGGVITSAGCVLAGTFAALATLPLVFISELGFAVAVGVLLDTIVVRSVLVTALNLDLGRHLWWPSKLGLKEEVPVGQAGDDVLGSKVGRSDLARSSDPAEASGMAVQRR